MIIINYYYYNYYNVILLAQRTLNEKQLRINNKKSYY